MTSSPFPEVIAVIPFSGFGSDELLMLPAGDGWALPSGNVTSGERVFAAASRIVLETTGLRVQPERLLYIVERDGGGLALGVLCSMVEASASPDDLRGEVVALTQVESGFEPAALREVLTEDLRSGFVRPVAHLIETIDGENRQTSVTW